MHLAFVEKEKQTFLQVFLLHTKRFSANVGIRSLITAQNKSAYFIDKRVEQRKEKSYNYHVLFANNYKCVNPLYGATSFLFVFCKMHISSS